LYETDVTLLAAAKRERGRGESNAFEQILKRYEKLIYHIAHRYFANQEDAMDASQEAILRIYKGLPHVTLDRIDKSNKKDKNGKKDNSDSQGGYGSLKAWICTVTANVCLSELRKPKMEIDSSDWIEAAGTESSAEESASARERAKEILSAMTKLPDDQRITLILRDMQGLSYDELALATNVSIGTVKSRLSRGRASLKKLLI